MKAAKAASRMRSRTGEIVVINVPIDERYRRVPHCSRPWYPLVPKAQIEDRPMPPQLYFFTSIVFAFVAWGIVAKRYIWPRLRLLPRTEALRPLLILHSFRFVGLAFVVTGVVSPAVSYTHLTL